MVFRLALAVAALGCTAAGLQGQQIDSQLPTVVHSSHSTITPDRVLLAARGVAAGTTAALLSVDNRREMAKCGRLSYPGHTDYDRDLMRPMYDGLCLRRWQHHLLRTFVATTVSDVTQRVTGLSEWKSAAIATLAVGVAPHLLGYARHKYGFHAGDWAADTWFASYPLVRATTVPVVGRLGAVTLWLGVYGAVYPYATP